MSDIPADDFERANRIGRPVGRFLSRWREIVRRRPWLNFGYKAMVSILGGAIVILGLILVPLPGPGWLIVFIGMTVLGAEYAWARRLTSWLRMALARFWTWWKAFRARRAVKRSQRQQPAPQLPNRNWAEKQCVAPHRETRVARILTDPSHSH